MYVTLFTSNRYTHRILTTILAKYVNVKSIIFYSFIGNVAVQQQYGGKCTLTRSSIFFSFNASHFLFFAALTMTTAVHCGITMATDS